MNQDTPEIIEPTEEAPLTETAVATSVEDAAAAVREAASDVAPDAEVVVVEPVTVEVETVAVETVEVQTADVTIVTPEAVRLEAVELELVNPETVEPEAEESDVDAPASTAVAEAASPAEAGPEAEPEAEPEAVEAVDLAVLEDELLLTAAANSTDEHAEAAESILGVHEETTEAPDLLPAEPLAQEDITATRDELKPVIEALLFVSEEPLPVKQLVKVLGEVPEMDVQAALEELVSDYEARQGGLEIREIAGGWRISTRPQHHDFIRKYLKSRPSAKLSLPALETLAVIAYKQPITVPEILEIRGVSSSSAIKTLLEKRLIVTKGRKETVGRPMMYGTSKDFLLQFGLRDLTELPSMEDFEDLTQ